MNYFIDSGATATFGTRVTTRLNRVNASASFRIRCTAQPPAPLVPVGVVHVAVPSGE